ncbi:MAG: hypothetical protein ACM3NO_07065, partial [Deltaproteobacteria bacterium]
MKHGKHYLLIGLTLLAALIFCATALHSPISAQEASKPLTKNNIIKLLKGDVPPARVETLARERGISFQVTSEVESELRQAGATDSLIATLKEVAPKPAAPAPHAPSQPAPAAPAPVAPVKTTALFAVERTLAGHANFVRSVAFSPDGRYLASGSM